MIAAMAATMIRASSISESRARGNLALRPVAVKAMAGSLDEAEVTIIRQAVEQCNWRTSIC
jgi:hypothetical protein